MIMKFDEVPMGTRVASVENMGNEVRCTWYEPREGKAKFSQKYRCAWSLRTIQGIPEISRFIPPTKPRFDSGEHRTATEIPNSLPVEAC